MTNIIEPINSYRKEEKDRLFVQFFDKKKQYTDEDLQTIDVLDENGKPIYDLYVEIYNKEDPYSVLCKKVEGNNIAVRSPQGAIKRFSYTEYYKNAYAIYLARKENKEKESAKFDESEQEIIKLKAELEKLKKQNEKKEAKEAKASNIKSENLE